MAFAVDLALPKFDENKQKAFVAWRRKTAGNLFAGVAASVPHSDRCQHTEPEPLVGSSRGSVVVTPQASSYCPWPVDCVCIEVAATVGDPPGSGSGAGGRTVGLVVVVATRGNLAQSAVASVGDGHTGFVATLPTDWTPH